MEESTYRIHMDRQVRKGAQPVEYCVVHVGKVKRYFEFH